MNQISYLPVIVAVFFIPSKKSPPKVCTGVFVVRVCFHSEDRSRAATSSCCLPRNESAFSCQLRAHVKINKTNNSTRTFKNIPLHLANHTIITFVAIS